MATTGALPVPQHTPIGRVLRDMVSYLPAVLIPYLLAPISSAIFTRTFHPSSYGVYSLTFAIAVPISDGIISWILQPTGRFHAEYHNKGLGPLYMDVVSISVVALTCFTLVGSGLALLLFLIFGIMGSSSLLLTGAITFMILRIPVTIGLQVFRSSLKPTSYLVVNLATTAIALTASIGLVFLVSHEVAWLAWGQALAVAVTLPYVWHASGFKFKSMMLIRDPETMSHVTRFARYAVPMTVWWAGLTVLSIEDRYVIAAFRDTSQVAIYSVNYSFVSSVMGLLTPLFMAFGPVVYRYSSQGFHDQVSEVITQMTDIYLYAGLFAVGGITITGPLVAQVLIGPAFRVGLVVLVPIAIGLFAYGVAWVGHSNIILGEGNRAIATSAILAAALNLALNLVFVPRYGYVSAAYSTAIAYGAYAVFIWWQSRRFVPWRISPKSVVSAAAVAGISVGCALASELLGSSPGAPGYLLRTAIYIAVFGLLVGLVERDRVLDAARRMGIVPSSNPNPPI